MSPELAKNTGEVVLARIQYEAARYGVDLTGLTWATARFDRQCDPASGEESALVDWRCDGRRVHITVRPDGSAFAEADLLVDHPHKPGFWMDVLEVWGPPTALKAEPTLIQKPR